MAAMNEMSLVLEELRAAANALASAADTLQRFFSAEEPAPPTPEEAKTITLEEVRDILRRKCEEGYATDVKALIESLGAKTLKEVDPDYYTDMLRVAETFGLEGGDGDA